MNKKVWFILIAAVAAVTFVLVLGGAAALYKILVAIATTGLLVYLQYVRAKNVFDGTGKRFDYETWLYEEREDLILCAGAALLVSALSSELAIPLITEYLNWESLAHATITYSGVAVCAYFGFIGAKKLIGKKE